MDQRGDGGRVFARVAEHLLVRVAVEELEELDGSGLLDEEARPRQAHLPGVIVLAGRLPGGCFDVGVCEHDQRPLAAELTGERDEVLRSGGRDRPACLGRARQRDATHARVGDECCTDLLADPLDDVEDAGRKPGLVSEAGDEIVRGGRVSEELGGLWYEPTLVIPRSNDSEIVQCEVFGPVLTFQTFTDEDEAVALANSTRYGLSGIVYTGSEERAERVGRAIRAGTVWVNTFLVRDLTAPFGGIGISGIGREGGDHALDFYSDLETLQIQAGSTAQ